MNPAPAGDAADRGLFCAYFQRRQLRNLDLHAGGETPPEDLRDAVVVEAIVDGLPYAEHGAGQLRLGGRRQDDPADHPAGEAGAGQGEPAAPLVADPAAEQATHRRRFGQTPHIPSHSCAVPDR